MTDIHILHDLLPIFADKYRDLRSRLGITVTIGMLDVHMETKHPIYPNGVSGFIFQSESPEARDAICQIFSDEAKDNTFARVPFRIVTPSSDYVGNGAEWQMSI